MKRYKKYLTGLLATLIFQISIAAKQTELDINPQNRAQLQRGAKLFMNYCSGCHSLRYLRYNRMASDLGLTNFDGQIDRDLLRSNLIFTSAKVEDPIKIAMPATEAREWFGIVPPDLSLIARVRGTRWIYGYLKGFYADSSRPFGANNRLLPDTAMPDVLHPLVKQVQNNAMSDREYEKTLEDLLSFLAYVAEPAQLRRYRVGKGVVLFLLILSVFACLLKRNYWKGL